MHVTRRMDQTTARRTGRNGRVLIRPTRPRLSFATRTESSDRLGRHRSSLKTTGHTTGRGRVESVSNNTVVALGSAARASLRTSTSGAHSFLRSFFSLEG